MTLSVYINKALFLQFFFIIQPVWSSTDTYNPYLETYPAEDSVIGTPLHFSLILSFPGGQFDSSGAVAGVRVALDRINSDPYLLQNYTLRYTLTNSSCNRTVALDAFFDQIIPGPTKLAVIGSGCSVATEPTAEVSHYYNITQISCVSSSTELRNRVRFPRYFQLLPTEETISLAYYVIIKEYGWRHVALIVQDENLFTVTLELLKTLFDEDGITYSENVFNTEDGIAGLGENTFDVEARIHIILTYAVHARPLLCEAFFSEIKYPRHLLFTPAWYSPRWWLVEDQNITCTAEQRESVLPKSLAFLHFEFLEDLNLTTTTGITGAEYFDEENAHLNNEPFNLTKLEYAQYCYDATWTLAYALNKTINGIHPNENLKLNEQLAEAYFGSSDTLFRLENFTYASDKLLNVIFGHIERTRFDGITGPVSFEDQGIRAPNRLTVFQFRPVQTENGTKLDWVEIGHVLPVNNSNEFSFNYAPSESLQTVWPGNLMPYDGVPVEKNATVSIAVTVLFSVLATAGIILAIFCLIFNFAFRNEKLVRLTSPKLNLLIGVGAIILYIDVYFTVVPTTNRDVVTFLCNFTPWLTAVGYSLCYGTIVVKMCRVYYIFNNPSTQKKMVIKDWMLALSVLLLVVIDLIILSTYTAVEGARGNLSAQRVTNRENPEDITGELGVVTRYYAFICDSKAQDIAIGILYGYKALLQIVAIVFAFSIRKVKIKGLDDSKYIAAAVYVTSIVTAVIIVAYYSLMDFVNGYTTLNSAGLFVGTTFILVLVFIPVMVGLYRDPEGETIFEKSSKSIPASSTSNHQTQTIDSLRGRIKELEDTVAKLKGRQETNFNGGLASKNKKETTDLPRLTTYTSPIEMVEQMMNSDKEQSVTVTSIWDGGNGVNH